MGGIRRSRSRGRDKDGFEQNAMMDSAVDPTARDKGIGSLRKQASAPGILLDSSFAAEYRRSTSKKAGGIPMKMLIDEEVSKDVNSRHTSPGVIGRLMGLDTLPSFGVHNQHNHVGSHSQRTSPGTSQDKYGFSEDVPRRRSTDEMPEFKDVFEVMEATRMNMHRNQKLRSGNMSSRLDKVDNADMDFIRQKFMDAKRLSTDESLQRSKEFNDALEALVSNKDLLLEFLQEPNPVLAKDLPDLSCSPSSNANRITILKPSRRNKFIDADIVYPLGKDTKSCFHIPKESKHSSRKPYANISSSQCFKEDCGSLRQKLSRSSYQESIDERIRPTRIVVLKPSLEKARNMEGAFPLTHEIFHSGCRRPKACQDVGIQGQHPEESVRQMSFGDSEALGHKAKGSREIAREITKQMRRAARGGGSGKRVLKPEIGKSGWDESSHFLSSMAKLKTSEAFHRSSELHDDWAHSFSSSPAYSTETSVSREARKRLSDRWKMTCQYQEQAPDANGLGTLGEMLSLSDREASKVAPSSMVCRKCPKGELHRDGIPWSCSHPLGISSDDGWKESTTSNLTRSKSLPSSSTIRGSPKSSSRKRSGRHSEFSMLKDVLKVGPYDSEDACHSRQRRSAIRSSTCRCDEIDETYLDEEENMLTEREIHVNSEEPTNTIAVPEISEQRLVYPENSHHVSSGEYYLDNSSAVPHWQDVAHSPAPQNQQMQQESASALDVKDERLLVPSLDDLVIQAEGIGHHEADHNPSLCNPPMESESPVSSKEDEQPSPVSVLESSLDTEDAYSGGFEKISADLQELRMQLRLLKMETMDNADETELLVLSDDEIATQSQPLSEMEEISYAFRDEEERDFSYLLDMLIDLGVHAAKQDELLGACYLLECPAGPDAYNRLEKKYNKLILWPRSERKLLFDLANSVLADIVASLMRCTSQGMLKRYWSKWDEEGFVEEVWQRVVRQRREMECTQEDRFMDLGWLGSEDGIDMVGGDIASMLHEDLLEEIIADFLV